MNSKMIDFTAIEGPVYTGRDRGVKLRKEYDLDSLDADAEQVTVKIPETTYTVSSSFFLGLFGPSIIKFGSKEAFYKHYKFELPDYLKETTESYVTRALQTRNLFQ